MDSIQLILKVLSAFFMLISMALIGWMLVTFRRVRSISALSCVFSLLFTSLIFAVYWFIVGTSLSWIILLGLAFFGLALGFLMGQSTRVWVEDGGKKARNTIWYLVFWAACFLVTQSLVTLGHSLSLNLGIGAMVLGTGVTFGSQGNIFLRLLILSPMNAGKKVSEEGSETDRFCRRCGSRAREGAVFCSECGSEI